MACTALWYAVRLISIVLVYCHIGLSDISVFGIESDDMCIYCLNFSEAILSFSVLLWFYHEARRLVMAILLKTKAWYLQNQTNEKMKHPNKTVNSQAFVKTAISSNITVFSIRYIEL